MLKIEDTQIFIKEVRYFRQEINRISTTSVKERAGKLLILEQQKIVLKRPLSCEDS